MPQIARTGNHVILTRASWDTYLGLVADRGDSTLPLLSFNGTYLELLSPGKEHELYSRAIEGLLNVVMTEWQINILAVGSMTLNSEATGAEPDNSFYIEHAASVVAEDDIDLSKNPPPDLAIEIDISRERSDKRETYRRFGVPEFWRLRPPALEGFSLVEGEYVGIAQSRVIPGLPLAILLAFVERSGELDRITVLSDWTTWLRTNRALHEEAKPRP